MYLEGFEIYSLNALRCPINVYLSSANTREANPTRLMSRRRQSLFKLQIKMRAY